MSDTDKGLGAWIKSWFADPVQDPATGEGTVNTLLLGKFQRLQAFKDSDLPYDEEEYLRLKELLGKAGGGMMNINEMIRPIGMAGGGLMDQVLDLDTLVKIVKLEGALPNKDTDNLRKMSPIEIEILYNDTFGEGN